MAAVAGGKREAVALEWLGNPVVIWGGAILLAAGAVYFFLPGLYNGGKAAAKMAFNDLSSGFSDTVDSAQSNISSIIGPGSNLPNQGLANEVKQTVAPGGRGLSDLMDYFGI